MPLTPISPELSQHVLEVAATNCNRFFLHVAGGSVRTTFGEQIDRSQPPVMRYAVMLSMNDAYELSKMLDSLSRTLSIEGPEPDLKN